MNIEKYSPLYTKLDEEYQKLYLKSSYFWRERKVNGWYSRPFVGEAEGDNIWYLDFLEQGRLSGTSKRLLKAGREAQPYYTQIIDLTKSETELHADIRKSYKSLINKSKIISRLCEVEPLRKLHVKAHGRETRSKETWFVQQKMLWQKQLFALLESKFTNPRNPHSSVSLAGGLFYYNSHICYYGVGCSVEGAGSHALLWEAIKYAKKLGCKEFDIGQQVFAGDEKMMNISKFKRGFGGKTRIYLEFRNE